MKKQMKCPYCGAAVMLAPASMIFGRNVRRKDDHLYICSRWPLCDAYVSAHRHNNSPMGTLANARLRRKRIQAHDALDAMRRDKHMNKWATYIWLQCKLGLDAEHTHIGSFSESMCDRVITLCHDAATQEQTITP